MESSYRWNLAKMGRFLSSGHTKSANQEPSTPASPTIMAHRKNTAKPKHLLRPEGPKVHIGISKRQTEHQIIQDTIATKIIIFAKRTSAVFCWINSQANAIAPKRIPATIKPAKRRTWRLSRVKRKIASKVKIEPDNSVRSFRKKFFKRIRFEKPYWEAFVKRKTKTQAPPYFQKQK